MSHENVKYVDMIVSTSIFCQNYTEHIDMIRLENRAINKTENDALAYLSCRVVLISHFESNIRLCLLESIENIRSIRFHISPIKIMKSLLCEK